jgi:hypothetical protein
MVTKEQKPGPKNRNLVRRTETWSEEQKPGPNFIQSIEYTCYGHAAQNHKSASSFKAKEVQGDHGMQTLLDSRPTIEGVSLTLKLDSRDANQLSVLVSRKGA